MKRVAFFCIPAHGHTNPMLPVAAELVKRGNKVRFYSFAPFEKKIRAAGAEYIPCDKYLAPLSQREEQGLKRVSITEMTVQDLRVTLAMDAFLDHEFQVFRPDVVYTDSACFWGKLNAWKHNVPMVVSTSTMAFNQLSSQYMKRSARETADMVFGLGRVSKELKKLEPYGYRVGNVLRLVTSDNQTDSVVYTSRRFQPYAESFSDRYLFAGPSVFSKAVPMKKKERPLVYISMGTVINDRPALYRRCIEALGDQNLDIVISCGNETDRARLGALPEHVQVYPTVDQPDVLSRADVFLTHCGMNSVSESLYMATPMVLYPQTGEQNAVARRAAELGAGVLLTDDSVSGIRAAVRKILNDPAYAAAAKECCGDLRSCCGAEGAAEFIERAPCSSTGADVIAELNRANVRFQLLYWLCAVAAILSVGALIGWRFTWLVGVAAGIFSAPLIKLAEKRTYAALIRK